MTIYQIKIEPIGKPRQTQRDKWQPSEAVQRYRNWAAEARLRLPLQCLEADPLRVSIRAFFALPNSWSKKKKAELIAMPHRQKPDGDNVMKALVDCYWKNDERIASWSIEKFWDDGNGARIEIEID